MMHKIDKESIQNRLRFAWSLFCMITACVITAMGILTLLGIYDSQISTAVLWQIPLMSIVLAFVSDFIYPFHRAMGKVEKVIRIFVHYVLVCTIVMTGGNKLYWYDIHSIKSTGIMFAIVTIVFVIVSVVSWKKSYQEADLLNSRLQKMQSEMDI